MIKLIYKMYFKYFKCFNKRLISEKLVFEPIYKKWHIVQERPIEAKMTDFGNNFWDMISARRFEANHHIMTFDTVLPDCHEIVDGILLDCSWNTVNLRIMFSVHYYECRNSNRTVIGRLWLHTEFSHIGHKFFLDCIILILFLKNMSYYFNIILRKRIFE